jgi:hypothetical protein
VIIGTFLTQTNIQSKNVPILVRIAVSTFLFFTSLIILLEVAAQTSQSPSVIEPPETLMPGSERFPRGAGCDFMQDGTFLCHIHVKGSESEVTYSGLGQRIVYTFVTTPDQTLGDLIATWGTPTGLTRFDQALVVFWSTRAAYLAPYSFAPETQIRYVVYGDNLKQTAIWRGFFSQTFDAVIH